jgi:hypothetical protein
MVSFVAPSLAWVGLAASFLLGLAAVIRMAGPAAGVDSPSGVIRLPREVTATVVSLFVLAAIVFLTHLFRLGRSRRQRGEDPPEATFEEARRVPTWVRALRQIVGLLYFVALAYALSRGGVSLDAILALGAGAGSAGGTALAGAAAESAPALVTWSFAVLAVFAGLGALGLALWVSLGARLARRDDDGEGPVAASPLEAAVDDSVEDLRAEPDPRRAIVRCYARFERAAAASGVERKPWSTPMEFMREALRRLPLPRTAVPTLTGLFELARFSHHPLGPSERDRALAALDEIRTAMRATESDAAGR